MLGQSVIHTNVLEFGPEVDPDGKACVQMFSRKVEPFFDRHSLKGISLAATIAQRGIELVFFDDSAIIPGWLELRGGEFFATATAKSRLEKRYLEFTNLIHEAERT